MNTRQHEQGRIIEDFIFNELKKDNINIYRQENSKNYDFSIPEEIREYLNDEIILLIEKYPFDFFLIEDNKFHIIEVKSKQVKFSKDDRKIDISHSQFDILKELEIKGIPIKMLIVWFDDSGYYYQFYDFRKLKIIEKKKLKLKLPSEIKYSPKNIIYKKFPEDFLKPNNL